MRLWCASKRRDIGAAAGAGCSISLLRWWMSRSTRCLLPRGEPGAVPAMRAAGRAAALDLLRDRQLLDRVLADFERAGVVGKETNRLVGYLVAVSRKLPEPLAVIIPSASAAGKTALMDAVFAFVPPEECVQYSAMTARRSSTWLRST